MEKKGCSKCSEVATHVFDTCYVSQEGTTGSVLLYLCKGHTLLYNAVIEYFEMFDIETEDEQLVWDIILGMEVDYASGLHPIA